MDKRLFDAKTLIGTTYNKITIVDVMKHAKNGNLTNEDSLSESGKEKWTLCSDVKGIEFQDRKLKSIIFNRITNFIFSGVLIPTAWFICYFLMGYDRFSSEVWVGSFVTGFLFFIIFDFVCTVIKTIFRMERNKIRHSSSSSPATVINSELANEITIKNLNNWFKIAWISAAAGIPLTLILIGIFGVIAYVIFACLILHKLWQIIPPDERETTPGKAVGYLFIPLYHLYFWYVSFLGLAKCLNAQTTKNKIVGKQVNEKFALVICILVPFGYIPYLGLLTGTVQIVFLILTIQQMKNAGIALIQNQLESE